MAIVNQVVVCGGTGCMSGNSEAIRDAFNKELQELGLQDEVQVILTIRENNTRGSQVTAGSFVLPGGKRTSGDNQGDRRDTRDKSDAIEGTLRAYTGIGDKRDRQAWREALTLPVPFVSGANLTRSLFKLRRFCLFGPLGPLPAANGLCLVGESFLKLSVRLTLSEHPATIEGT